MSAQLDRITRFMEADAFRNGVLNHPLARLSVRDEPVRHLLRDDLVYAVRATKAMESEGAHTIHEVASAWDEGFEAGATYVESIHGVPHDPPANPYSGLSPEDPVTETPAPEATDVETPDDRHTTTLMATIKVEIRVDDKGQEHLYVQAEDIKARQLPKTKMVAVLATLVADTSYQVHEDALDRSLR